MLDQLLRAWHGPDIMRVFAILSCSMLAIVILARIVTLLVYPRRSLRGQTAVVTGAARGVGLEVAVRLLDRGVSVVMWDRDEQALKKSHELLRGVVRDAAGSSSVRCDMHCVDVSDSAAVQDAAARVLRDGGRVDILVNNAGVVYGESLLDATDEQVRDVLGTNCLANFWTTRAFLPHMVERDSGHVVTVSSIAGFQGVSHLAPYTVSKFGSWGFSDCLRHELWSLGRHRSIHTTAVFPYLIDTRMFEGVATPWAAPLVAGGALRKERVADEIVHAIETRREVVIIPSHLALLHLMRLIPTRVMDWLTRFIGAAGAMVGFQTRRAAARKKDE